MAVVVVESKKLCFSWFIFCGSSSGAKQYVVHNIKWKHYPRGLDNVTNKSLILLLAKQQPYFATAPKLRDRIIIFLVNVNTNPVYIFV